VTIVGAHLGIVISGIGIVVGRVHCCLSLRIQVDGAINCFLSFRHCFPITSRAVDMPAGAKPGHACANDEDGF
jgi:hypothetical protein